MGNELVANRIYDALNQIVDEEDISVALLVGILEGYKYFILTQITPDE